MRTVVKILILLMFSLLYLALAIWGWGGWRGFFANPARTAIAVYGLIRHPSYLGLLMSLAGWVLVFRSGIGLLVALPILPLILVRIRAEETLLLSEFGQQYADYQRRTWRLIPGGY